MIYFAPLILLTSTWIAVTNKSWRPFCLAIATFSLANIIYAILKSQFAFHWETNSFYYIIQDFLLIGSVWLVNKKYKPVEYSDRINAVEPLIIQMYLLMIFYNAVYWGVSSYPVPDNSVFMPTAQLIHSNYGLAFAMMNSIVVGLLLHGGGFYGRLWRTSRMVYSKLPKTIRAGVSSACSAWFVEKREKSE